MAKKVLLLGYGNPGRLDDGLGPAVAEILDKEKMPGLTVDSNYQLNVEDASSIAEHDIVIFADAAVEGQEPYFFKKVDPRKETSFSSHSISPEAVLALAQEMFHSQTVGYALGIRGYEFNEFGQRLSEKAQGNLKQAVEFLKYSLTNEDFVESE